MIAKEGVKNYHKTFIELHKELRINIFHKTIFRNLASLCLTGNSNRLEIYCEIRAIVKVVLKYISDRLFILCKNMLLYFVIKKTYISNWHINFSFQTYKCFFL